MIDILIILAKFSGLLIILLVILYIIKSLIFNFVKRRINKSLYTWIDYTNFGKSSVLLNAISDKCEIDFTEGKPWTNFKKINNFFVDMSPEEISLMKDYLEKTEAKFSAFQNKFVNILLIGTPSIIGLASVINFIVKDQFELLTLSLLVISVIYIVIWNFERQRNIHETLIMFIERAEKGQRVPLGDGVKKIKEQ